MRTNKIRAWVYKYPVGVMCWWAAPGERFPGHNFYLMDKDGNFTTDDSRITITTGVPPILLRYLFYKEAKKLLLVNEIPTDGPVGRELELEGTAEWLATGLENQGE